MLPLIGYNFAAQKKERVGEIVVKAGLISFTWGVLCWVVSYVVFNSNYVTIRHGPRFHCHRNPSSPNVCFGLLLNRRPNKHKRLFPRNWQVDSSSGDRFFSSAPLSNTVPLDHAQHIWFNRVMGSLSSRRCLVPCAHFNLDGYYFSQSENTVPSSFELI